MICLNMALSLQVGEQINRSGVNKMINQLNSRFQMHEQMLDYRMKRSEVIASNMANSDTPGYKARDIDFQAFLDSQINDASQISTTQSGHMGAENYIDEMALLYRIPSQPTLDGNTVDTQVENAQFTENTVRYLASLRFLDGKIKSTLSAIRGE